jgi:two-component system response regulator YesN
MYKVLIADDEALIRNNLKTLLLSFGYGWECLYTAEDGVEALMKIREHKPHIAIFDINMPFLNGLDAIRKIRQIDKDIIIIIVTGYDKFEYAKEAIANHVFAYILKPVNETEFRTAIQSALDDLDQGGSNVEKNKPLIEGGSDHQIVHFITDHLADTEMGINTICDRFHISASSLARFMKKQTGCTFTDYLTKVRMKTAIHLLENHDALSIKEISSRSGFKNQHYFSRAFKNYTGMSPKKYKESIG